MTNHSVRATNRDLGPRRLTGQRWRFALALLGALAFVGVGWLMWTTDHSVVGRVLAVLVISVFSVFALGIAINLVSPPCIDLDERGLTVRRPPFGVQRDTWAEIGPAAIWHYGRQKIVTFESPGFAAAHGWQARLNRGLGAQGAGLQPWLGGLKAEELADLLNAYREAYGQTGSQ